MSSILETFYILFETNADKAKKGVQDAEKATDRAVNKFLGRWLYITRKLAARGRSPEDATPAELDLIWNEAREKGL